jgi:hypothetical protein
MNPWRTRCIASSACWATFFTATKRMLGRDTASQIASASAASFLLAFTYGLTNWGAIKRTVCPNPCSFLAQW